MLINKLKKRFYSLILFLLLSFLSISSLATTNSRPCLAETNKGGLNISLFCKWLGGTSNQFNRNDPTRTFLFDIEKNAYYLDFPLYENDEFYISILNTCDIGFPGFNDNIDSVHLAKANSSSNFYVKTTGTYHFEISASIEDLPEINAEDIWTKNFVKISYISSSTDFRTASGSLKIYLYGSFDGKDFSYPQTEEYKFSFVENTYYLKIKLKKGDVFAPFVSSNINRFITYYNDDYANQMFSKNYIDIGFNNYFLCKKDGIYEISLSYKVEYYPIMEFGWSKFGGSLIKFLSSNIYDYDSILGNEDIVLSGMINGELIYQSSSTYSLEFDWLTYSYKIRIWLDESDFFSLYMKQKAAYINYLTDSPYFEALVNSCGITSYISSSRRQLRVSQKGYYEISVFGDVENYSNPTEIWNCHRNTYVRYLGQNIKTMYFVADEQEMQDISLITFSDKSNIKQYGINGIEIIPIPGLIFNYIDEKYSGRILKVNFDPNYNDRFLLSYANKEQEVKIEGELLDHAIYSMASKEFSYLPTNSLNFLLSVINQLDLKSNNTVSDLISKISENDADLIFDNYNNLSDDGKESVNKSSFYGYSFEIINNKIIEISNQKNQLNAFLVNLFLIIAVCFLFFIFLLICKRHFSK